MVKNYKKVSNEQRKELIRLIYEENYNIKSAGLKVGISYPSAKSVNQIYQLEKRTAKKTFRFRLKNIDIGKNVCRNRLLIEKINPFDKHPLE